MILQIARYKRGIPLMKTVTHAGSKGKTLSCIGVPPNSSAKWGTRSSSKKNACHNGHGQPGKQVIYLL